MEFDDTMKLFCTSDETLDELKAAAFEVLHLNPGSEFGDWQSELINNYSAEVIDVYGGHANPEDVFSGLSDLWQSEYKDVATGIERTFAQWAAIFCNEEARDFYYTCAELINEHKQADYG